MPCVNMEQTPPTGIIIINYIIISNAQPDIHRATNKNSKKYDLGYVTDRIVNDECFIHECFNKHESHNSIFKLSRLLNSFTSVVNTKLPT